MITVRVFRSMLTVVAGTLLSLAMAGCTEAPTTPSSFSPFSQTDLRVGTGPAADFGAVLTVHYTGWLYDASQPDQKGAQFDSSAGFNPFIFILGAGQVIAGWEQGLVGMQAGGLRRLVIPPSLGYGATRTNVIPPNATLVFEIDLLEVE
jgi:FKBP-type peptidyl-prolyl cis-trans isomerase FkpA